MRYFVSIISIISILFSAEIKQQEVKVDEKYFYVEPLSIEKVIYPKIQKEIPKVIISEEKPQEDQNESKEEEIFEDLPSEDLNTSEEIVPEVILPPDEDGDGVEDKLDMCPNTPSGFKVKADGCPKKATLKVSFAPDRYDIAPNMSKKLEAFAQFLKENTNYQVIIYGYTDSIGEYETNKILSQKRADSVKEALIKLGVSSTKLTAIGRGEDNPIASNMHREGRKKNRRIEAELIY